MKYLTEEAIYRFIDNALAEDVGEGDHSSLAAVPAGAQQRARLIVKAEGILAGVDMARHILQRVDPSLQMDVRIADGKTVKPGDIAFTVSGNARSILQAERLLLNCMQRMSGIATHTNQIVRLLKGSRTRLLDTRKTTPNFRLCEKWAVKIGGGENHRFGLYDMIMLKDNHNDYAGGIVQALQAAKQYVHAHDLPLRIEVETRNLQEVQLVLDEGGADVIMLDNFGPEQLREAVAYIAGRCQTEASGGITLRNIGQVAASGVDFISMGALTHSSPSLDMSLKAY